MAKFKPVPLTPEEIEQLNQDIEDTCDRMLADLRNPTQDMIDSIGRGQRPDDAPEV